jgi:hypothetical protein
MKQGEDPLTETLTSVEQQAIFLNRAINLKNTFRTGKPPASLQDEGYKGEP